MQLLTPFRGVAALWVVLFHWTPHLPRLGAPETAWYGLFASGYLWVDFFFVLSGFVLAHVYGTLPLERRPVKAYVWARFTRIYPLHLAILLLLVAVEVVKLGAAGGAFEGPERSIKGLALHLSLLHAVGLDDDLSWNRPSWSIGAEWLSYLAFPLLIAATRRTSARSGVVLGIALLAGTTALSLLHGDLDAAHDFGALRCALELSLGTLAYRHLHATSAVGDVGDRRLGLGLLLTVCLLALPPGPWRDAGVVPVFVLLVVALASATGARASSWLGNPLARRIGDASYAIYMTHALAHPILRRMRPRLLQGLADVPPALAVAAEAALLCAGSLLLVFVSDLVFRRFEDPVKRTLRRRWRPA